MTVSQIAVVCHEANRAYCISLGDYSQSGWEDAQSWQKNSAIQGVQFKIDNPDAGDDAQHNSWVQQKMADGWEYGEMKNADMKTHPCIVDFEELPIEQKLKDKLFAAIVNALK